MIAAHTPISGQQQEECGSASVDSGLFTAFLESGDVKVVTVGHDHANDYCGAWKMHTRSSRDRPGCARGIAYRTPNHHPCASILSVFPRETVPCRVVLC